MRWAEKVCFDMNRKWTDRDIFNWAADQFGAPDALTVAIRMNKEVSELLTAVQNGKFTMACEELADMRVFMAQLNVICGAFANDRREISERVDEKMDINEKRSWGRAPDGSFQHVEET